MQFHLLAQRLLNWQVFLFVQATLHENRQLTGHTRHSDHIPQEVSFQLQRSRGHRAED